MIIFVCCNNYKTFNEFFGLEKQMKIYSISPPGDKLTGFLHTVNKTVFIITEQAFFPVMIFPIGASIACLQGKRDRHLYSCWKHCLIANSRL